MDTNIIDQNVSQTNISVDFTANKMHMKVVDKQNFRENELWWREEEKNVKVRGLKNEYVKLIAVGSEGHLFKKLHFFHITIKPLKIKTISPFN